MASGKHCEREKANVRGLTSAIVLLCLFWACSLSCGARVVIKNVCLHVEQMMFLADSLTCEAQNTFSMLRRP